MNTTYFLNLLAGNILRTKTNPTIPTNYYLGLSKSQPTASGTGVTEPSSSYGYGRIKLENLSQPTNGVVSNTAEVMFNEATGSWGTVSHFVVYDAATGGNLLMYGALSPARTAEAGTTIAIRAGSLKLSIANIS